MTEVKFEENKEVFAEFLFNAIVKAAGVASVALEDAAVAITDFDDRETILGHLKVASEALVVLGQLKSVALD